MIGISLTLFFFSLLSLPLPRRPCVDFMKSYSPEVHLHSVIRIAFKTKIGVERSFKRTELPNIKKKYKEIQVSYYQIFIKLVIDLEANSD